MQKAGFLITRLNYFHICIFVIQLNNDETPRFGSKVAGKYQKAFQALNLLLPGTAFVYYGDEIAMTNGVVNGAANKDPLSAAGKVRHPKCLL